MIKRIDIILDGGMCGCEDSKWSLRVDFDSIKITCAKCKSSVGTGAAKNLWKFKVEHQGEPKSDCDGTITRRLSSRECDLLDAIRSESRGRIEHTFSDGFYWVNLDTNDSKNEARLMDHCGNTGRGVLWSLRDRNKIPHITMTVTPAGDGVDLYERHNNPVRMKKYGKYIHGIVSAGCISGFEIGNKKKE